MRVDGGIPADAVGRTWEVYERLFRVSGLDDAHIREHALGCLAALAQWAPDLADELAGVAAGSGLATWQVAALTARTEVLGLAGVVRRGECSTVVDARGPGAPVGAQTWDWHRELAGSWYVRAGAGDLPFVTLTEYGIPAKVGVNAAGVGVLLNILGHRSDGRAPGVPVHALCRRVLDTATSLEHAVEIVRSARVGASSCLTVLDGESAAAVEVSPAGVASLGPVAGFVVHTNHFEDEALAAGEVRGQAEPETYDRLALLRGRVAGRSGPSGRDVLADVLLAHADTGAQVCCHPEPGATFGERWQTLATVVVDPRARTLAVHPGPVCEAAASNWSTWTAYTPPPSRDQAIRGVIKQPRA